MSDVLGLFYFLSMLSWNSQGLFLSFFLVLISVYPLIVSVEVFVAPDHTGSHSQAVELLWTRNRPVVETFT